MMGVGNSASDETMQADRDDAAYEGDLCLYCGCDRPTPGAEDLYAELRRNAEERSRERAAPDA